MKRILSIVACVLVMSSCAHAKQEKRSIACEANNESITKPNETIEEVLDKVTTDAHVSGVLYESGGALIEVRANRADLLDELALKFRLNHGSTNDPKEYGIVCIKAIYKLAIRCGRTAAQDKKILDYFLMNYRLTNE